MSRGPDLAKRAVWRRRLREFERSAETVDAFCDRAGVSINTFYRWRRKLARLAAADETCRPTPTPTTPNPAAAARATPSPGAGPAMNFLPVEIVAATHADVVEVRFPNGAWASVPCRDHEVIRVVLASLLAEGTTRASREYDRC